MHDTDRILAELEALDGPVHEGELEDEGVVQGLQEMEGLEEMEFEPVPRGAYETGVGGAQYEDEAAYEDEAQYECQYEGEGELQGAPTYESNGHYEAEDEYEDEHEDAFEDEIAAGMDGGIPTRASGVRLDELQEMELAAELLETQDEAGLDHWIGSLLSGVLGKGGGAGGGKGGNALMDMIKGAVKTLAPVAGRVIGGIYGGPAGSMIGGAVGDKAGSLLGLELEGLANEDQEFEAARGFVRFASDAAHEWARTPAGYDPVAAAQRAVDIAARRYAPGLFAADAGGPGFDGPHPRHRRMTGRWVRISRNQIVLHGL